MSFRFVEPWHAFLPRDPGHVVAIAGSGGKTSLLLELARIYQQEGVPVALTTTTRTEPLPESLLPAAAVWELTELKADSERAADTGDGLPGVCFVRDGCDAAGKWRGLTPAAVDEVAAVFDERVILVEADGAAELPLKLHRDDEPVWPPRTSLALLVMGAHAVGEPAQRVLHRFGRLEFGSTLDLQPHTIWLWDHMLRLLLDPGGYLSRVPRDVPTVLVLTGLDDQPDSVGLFDFLGRAMADTRLPLAMLCALDEGRRTVRTVCREVEDAGDV